MSSIPPPNDNEEMFLRGGGAHKRARENVNDEEAGTAANNNDNHDDDMRAIRRARSEEEKEPCTKMARLPWDDPPSLSLSWPSCLSSTKIASSDAAPPPPSLQDTVDSAIKEEKASCGWMEKANTDSKMEELYEEKTLAPSLLDYCAPDGTSLFLPRPEWVASFQRSTKRATTGTRVEEVETAAINSNAVSDSSLVPAAARAAEAAAPVAAQQEEGENAQQSENNSSNNGQEGGRNANNAAAADAPNNGLLPDHLFNTFSSPEQGRLRQLRRAFALAASSAQRNSRAPAPAPAPTAATERQQQQQQQDVDTSATVAIERQHLAIAAAYSISVDGDLNGAAQQADDAKAERKNATSSPAAPPLVRLAVFNRECDTALHYAIREGATEAALDLIFHGASVHADNGKGVTPLVLASQKGNLVVTKALLQRGASPLAATVTGNTSLLQAAHFGHLQIIKLLLQHGARLELANYKNTTPLMRAAQEGHDDVCKLLLENGAMVNRRNNDLMSAHMLASQRGHAHVVKRLLDHKAEINATTGQASTALHLACKRGHVAVVKVLVTAGCEMFLRDARGRTARDMAQRKNHKELLQLLSPTMQVELMQRKSRKQRSHVMIQLWTLLQQERAVVPVPDENHIANGRVNNMTIHQVANHFYSNNTRALSSLKKGTRALVCAMTLPAPLLEHIATFVPLPHLWNKRIGLITKRCGIDADSSVSCALDLIDEVLEEGGFVEACDVAGVTPPPHFRSWVRTV